MLGKVCLQIGGLERQVGIGDAVGFGKTIIGKLPHQRENLLSLVAFDSPGYRTQDELLLLLGHLFTVLLSHRLTQAIGFSH